MRGAVVNCSVYRSDSVRFGKYSIELTKTEKRQTSADSNRELNADVP